MSGDLTGLCLYMGIFDKCYQRVKYKLQFCHNKTVLLEAGKYAMLGIILGENTF